MKISYNWLKDYINIDISPNDLSNVLTNCGLEVEELYRWQSVKGGLEGIVIGKVVEKQKHADADKLSVTKVDIGKQDLLQIVCGAPNVESGQKVLVATVGTTLYKDDEEWKITKAKIRGVESYGMICAEDEIGIGSSHDGIMVLPEDAPIGINANKYFNVIEDWIFTIGLTPNRIDASSHIGVARDVASVLNLSNKNKISVVEPKSFEIKNENLPVEVIVDDTDACPRYSGVTISDIKIDKSPEWLTQRLLSCGMRPINNVVDITNYVMLEYGQPLHAFDIEKIKGNKIIVKKFNKNFKFKTLDEVDREITTDDLMICNAEEGMCIAGVFGGLNSGVNSNTKEIFLESAFFNPVSVRKTSTRHNLKTESSFRFERGANPSITIDVLKRASQLICEIAGGKISSKVYDVYKKTIPKAKISFTHNFVNDSVGHIIPDDVQISILKDLDFDIKKLENGEITIEAPYAKVDVTRSADVVEEILRVYGYNNIPFPKYMKSNLTDIPKPNNHKIQNIFSEMLVANGFYEIMTNSLSASKYYTKENGFEEEKNVVLLNPLSNELNVMRRTLLFSGLESVSYNIKRKQNNLRFFEFGKTYKKLSDNSSEEVSSRFKENKILSLFMTGNAFPTNWRYKGELSLFDIKNQVELIIKKAGFEAESIVCEDYKIEILEESVKYIHKSNNKLIAIMGKVSKRVLDVFDLQQDVYYADICWSEILDKLSKTKIKSVEPSKYPEVHRDLALLIDKSINYQEIKDIVVKEGGKKIVSVNLFDVYEGKNIPENKKSYAINIILTDVEKTMTDEDTNRIIDKIIASLNKKLGATIR